MTYVVLIAFIVLLIVVSSIIVWQPIMPSASTLGAASSGVLFDATKDKNRENHGNHATQQLVVGEVGIQGQQTRMQFFTASLSTPSAGPTATTATDYPPSNTPEDSKRKPQHNFLIDFQKGPKNTNTLNTKKTKAKKKYVRDAQKCGSPLFQGDEWPTNCPEEDIYLLEWRQRREASHHWVLVDVGANKGYSIAGMLGALGVAGYSKRALASELFQYAERENALLPGKRHMLCGACCECTEEPLPSSLGAAKGGWEIHAFDGTKSHVDFLNYYFQKKLGKDEVHLSSAAAKRDSDREVESANVITYHMAVSDRSQASVSFPQAPLGDEGAALSPAGGTKKKFPMLSIPQVTLDTLFPAPKEIDVLLTDTEGFDFNVANGASNLLREGRVGLYIFELHFRSAAKYKKYFPLQQLIEELTMSTDYDCYFPLRGTNLSRKVMKISLPFCFDTASFLNVRGWVNAVCIHSRKHPELKIIFDELEKTGVSNPRYHCFGDVVKKRFFEEVKPKWSWRWGVEGV